MDDGAKLRNRAHPSHPLPTGLLHAVSFSTTILAVRTRALEGRGRGVAVHIKIENTNYAMEGPSGL